jgi:hypothetical protein
MASSSTSTLGGTAAAGAKKQPATASTLKSSVSTSSLITNKNSKSTESLKITKPTIAPQNNASNKFEDSESKTKQTLAVDDELMEFERLEEYVEEHPSFRSSTSFVESIFTSSHNSSKKSPSYGASSSSSVADDSITHELAKMLKELQLSNPNNLKLNYMLSLIGANNNSSSSQRKLADLSEEDEKQECDDQVEVEAENNNENVNGDYDEKDSHMSSPNNNECNQKNYDSYGYEDEDESVMMQKLLGKSSSSSDENSKVVVLRKIKRIQQQKNGKANLVFDVLFFTLFNILSCILFIRHKRK